MKNLIVTMLLLLAIRSPALASFTVPALPNPVNDYSNVLSAAGKERIAHEIVTLKKETGAQAGVLIVDTLNGESIEEASMKTATQWKLGDQGKDNGVLLLVAVKDHKMRIEVGRGLEGNLTDYRSKQITSGMRPYLRNNDFNGGVAYAISNIGVQMKAAKAEAQTAPPVKDVDGSDNSTLFGVLLVMALIGGIGSIIFYRKKQREAEELEAQNQRELEKALRLEREARERLNNLKDTVKQPSNNDAANIAAAALAGAALGVVASKARSHYHDTPDYRVKEEPKKKKKQDDDSYSSSSYSGGGYSSSSSDSYSSSSSSSSDSDSGSSWGGGGGDFGGGGSSDSW